MCSSDLRRDRARSRPTRSCRGGWSRTRRRSKLPRAAAPVHRHDLEWPHQRVCSTRSAEPPKAWRYKTSGLHLGREHPRPPACARADRGGRGAPQRDGAQQPTTSWNSLERALWTRTAECVASRNHVVSAFIALFLTQARCVCCHFNSR